MPSLAVDWWRERAVAEAMTWLYTPYQHKAMVKGVGVDCGGLLYAVYQPLLGIARAFPQNYAADWALHHQNEIYLDFIRPYVFEVPAPLKGGIAVFKIGRNFSHGAICDGEGQFIHAWGRNGQGCVKRNRREFFNTYFVGERPVKFFDLRT